MTLTKNGDIVADGEIKGLNLPQPTKFYNDTGLEIAAYRWINVGPTVTAGVVKGGLADASDPRASGAVGGITLEAVANGAVGDHRVVRFLEA